MKNKSGSATRKPHELTPAILSNSKLCPGNTDGYVNRQLIPDGMKEPAHFPARQQ